MMGSDLLFIQFSVSANFGTVSSLLRHMCLLVLFHEVVLVQWSMSNVSVIEHLAVFSLGEIQI